MQEQTDQKKPARRYQCRHIFTDGHRCGSPCLRNEDFCYYHHSARCTAREAQASRDCYAGFTLPRLEDRNSVLLAIDQVLQRLASDALDTRRAGLLLYGLQTACLALPKEDAHQRDSSPVEEIVRHPSLGAVARRAIVMTEGAEGEDRPTLAEQEELAALDKQEDSPEAPNPKPTGFAAMTQEEIVQLYEKHTANLSKTTTPQLAILAALNASTEAFDFPRTATNARVPHPSRDRGPRRAVFARWGGWAMGGKAQTPIRQPFPFRSEAEESAFPICHQCSLRKPRTRTHPPFLLS